MDKFIEDKALYYRTQYRAKRAQYNELLEEFKLYKRQVSGASRRIKAVVRALQGGKCLCGEAGVVVHHKDRDRSNNELSNLVLLCKKCHKAEHDKQ